MSKLKLLCIILCISLNNCKAIESDWNRGTASSNETIDDGISIRIVGGRPAEQIIPYQVSIQRILNGRNDHFCGGSIITATHVVTAAHCLVHVPAHALFVIAGTKFWRQGGDRHRVLNFRWHPGFSGYPVLINDIAVIKVWPPFDFGKPTISIIPLGRREYVGANVPVRVTGWGVVDQNSKKLAEQLQVLDYTTISNQQCVKHEPGVTANELCALAEPGRSSCYHDSGGPLVTLNGPPLLVGIVCYGGRTCAQGSPDVYTRVSRFLPFIDNAITVEMP